MWLKHKAFNALFGLPLDVVCMLRAYAPQAHHSWIPDKEGLRPVTSEEAACAAVVDGLALASAIRAKVREKMAIRERVRATWAKASPAWKEVFRKLREQDQTEARRRNEKARD